MAIFALLGAAGSALAATADSLFEVDDVKVDVTAETAAAARERALAEGQTKAFRVLLERLVLAEDMAKLPSARPADVTPLVRDFSVSEEKRSAVRYLAALTYRFKPDDVRRYLVDHGLPYAETRSKPVLVLPVYQAAGALLLWDEPNPWRQAWAERGGRDGLVPLLLPFGDLTDIAAIGAEQAVQGDTQRLAVVASRYRCDDTLVAQAVLGLSGRTGRPELEVFITRHGATRLEQTLLRTYAAGETESNEALLRRAASDVSRQIENTWKRENLMQFGQRSVIAVTVPIKGLADWIEVQKRLSGVAVVRSAELVLMSRDEVRVNLHYLGETEQLALALRQADLNLQLSGDNPVLGLDGGGPQAGVSGR